MAYLSAEPLRIFPATNFTGNYEPIGTPLTADVVKIRVFNQTNQGVLISMDGVNHAEYIEGSQIWELVCMPGVNSIRAGTQFYLNAPAGIYNQGNVYLSAFYDLSVDI